MVLNGDTNKSLADYLGISETSVSNKINEKGTQFTQGEISKIKKRYSLTDTQTIAIFFSWEVSLKILMEVIMVTGESILRTLIELLEAQEQIKITYEIREAADSNGRYDARRVNAS